MVSWEAIEDHIGVSRGRPFRARERGDVGGGCISRALRLVGAGGDGDYFLKLHDADRLDMFAAEAAGLRALAAAGGLRVPQPLCWGVAGDSAYLVMDYIPLGGSDGAGLAALGRGLAQIHRTGAAHFGWERDNTIGATPQINTPDGDWIRFWRDRRLGFQLDLAARNGHGGALQVRGARLQETFPALFAGYRPVPSLLHGDLWSGNYAMDAAGAPVIFDPAVYHGDREADLAMTELFGGFGPRFYAAYRDAWPLDPGYGVRKDLYNLYHVLNHLNLFGGGYLHQAQAMIDRLLAELA